jgi:hypothetical protein
MRLVRLHCSSRWIPLLLCVRGAGRVVRGGTMGHYVNDRPYAASSFLSVAIAEVFGTALARIARMR